MTPEEASICKSAHYGFRAAMGAVSLTGLLLAAIGGAGLIIMVAWL